MNEFRAELLAETIVLKVLNRDREYRGLETRVSNELLKELIQEVKEMLVREKQ